MRHVNLLFAAATILCGPVTALRAEPLPAPDLTVISAGDFGPSVGNAPADARQARVAAPRPRSGQLHLARRSSAPVAVGRSCFWASVIRGHVNPLRNGV